MIVNENSTELTVRSESGIKGYNLYLLSKASIPVSPWVIIGKSTFNQFCEYSEINHLIDSALQQINNMSSPSIIQETESKIRNLILSTPLPDDLETEIKEAYHYLNSNSIAVRSSIVDKNDRNYSFAGLHANFLCISSIEQIISCIKKCWISAFSVQALSYRLLNNLDKRSSLIEIAVILQDMVQSEKSGKLFTTDFLENSDQTIISAMYGIFQDSITFQADKYIVKNQKIASIGIVQKSTMNIPDQTACNILTVSVPKRLQMMPCLTNCEIISLAMIGKKIELLLNSPQEIEWTWAPSKGFIILQSRQIINRSDTKSIGNDKTAKNCKLNVKGLTLPLTFSLKKLFYCNSFFILSKFFWISKKKLNELIPCLDQIYGSMFGRTYFNLKNLHYLSSFILPNLILKKRNSIPENTSANNSQPPVNCTFKNFLVALNFFWFHFRINHLKRDFCDSYERILSKYARYNLKNLSVREICDIYFVFENEILKKWIFPSVNDFLSMFYFKYLRFLTKRWLSHLGITLEQLIQLTSDKSKNNETFKNDICNNNSSGDIYDNQIDALINSNLPAFKKNIFRWFLENTRKTVQNRKIIRFYRSQITYFANYFFDTMGKIYSNQKIIGEPEDIYYLHLNELKRTFNDSFYVKNINSLIHHRKDQYRTFKEITPPDRIITAGPVYFLNNSDNYQIHSLKDVPPEKIKGIGLSNGIAEGKVMIVTDYCDVQKIDGNILVCKDLNFKFISALKSFSGILIEKDISCSHFGTIVREIGIPIITGINDLTKKLRTGLFIRIDGTKGLIEVISQSERKRHPVKYPKINNKIMNKFDI